MNHILLQGYKTDHLKKMMIPQKKSEKSTPFQEVSEVCISLLSLAHMYIAYTRIQ